MADKKKNKNNDNKPLVMKFGGTSVGSAEAITQTVGIITSHHTQYPQLVVVASAMNGITNLLLTCAHNAAEGQWKDYTQGISAIESAHLDTISALVLSSDRRSLLMTEMQKIIKQLRNYCASIETMGEVTPRGLDAIVSLGERMNVRQISALLEEKGFASRVVEADALIITDNEHQNARPIRKETLKRTRSVLEPLLAAGVIPVVTGFIGATEQGVTTTLGRGGSDYSASILGDCLDAQAVWTWTDVDGVMTADPRIVTDARVIERLSFDEVSEMAYFGAKVLHPKTMRPLIESNIPLWVKNTFNPTHPGTCISNEPSQKIGKITCVTAIRDVSLITVRGKGMLGVPGVAARTFSAVASKNASVLMISQSSSEQSICFVIPSMDQAEVTVSLEKELAYELARGDIDAVLATPDVVIVTGIGAGMRNTPGVSAKIFNAVGAKDINVIAIAQGSSEYSISLVVDKKDADMTVRQIHTEVIINGHQ
jgi:aspartate kinase